MCLCLCLCGWESTVRHACHAWATDVWVCVYAYVCIHSLWILRKVFSAATSPRKSWTAKQQTTKAIHACESLSTCKIHHNPSQCNQNVSSFNTLTILDYGYRIASYFCFRMLPHDFISSNIMAVMVLFWFFLQLHMQFDLTWCCRLGH